MPKQVVQYVIKRGVEDGIDYNMDGTIDENDDIVIKLVNGKEVSRRPLNEKVVKKLEKIVKNDDGVDPQRVVYERMPPAQVAEDHPIVVKDGTTFGQYVKQGVGLGGGMELGRTAVDAGLDLLGGLFGSEGGGWKRPAQKAKPKAKPKARTSSK